MHLIIFANSLTLTKTYYSEYINQKVTCCYQVVPYMILCAVLLLDFQHKHMNNVLCQGISTPAMSISKRNVLAPL